jgi:hypothetical protein
MYFFAVPNLLLVGSDWRIPATGATKMIENTYFGAGPTGPFQKNGNVKEGNVHERRLEETKKKGKLLKNSFHLMAFMLTIF